jgi:hypothetical protein
LVCGIGAIGLLSPTSIYSKSKQYSQTDSSSAESSRGENPVITSSKRLQLMLEVIAGSLHACSIQQPPEAQYQDEFYRSCHAYSDGLLRTFPEFGTTKGRADFYIPSMQWGVELVREGDRLEQHSGRFSRSGSYASTLLLSDYIILDFRNTRPEHPHPSKCNYLPINLFPLFSS